MAKIVGWKNQGARRGGTSFYTRYGPNGIEQVRTQVINGVKYRLIYKNGTFSHKEQVNNHNYGSPGLRKRKGKNYVRVKPTLRRKNNVRKR